MNITELFDDFYTNIKNDNWPSLIELQEADHIDEEILSFIVHTYQLPDEDKEKIDRLQIICDILKISSIPEHIVNGKRIDPNQALYETLQQESWPKYEEFLVSHNKSLEIIQQLYLNFEKPLHLDTLDKIDEFRHIFNVPDKFPDSQITSGKRLDPNRALYEMSQQPDWPNFDEFVNCRPKSMDIIKELYFSFELPVGKDSKDKVDLFKRAYNVVEEIPDYIVAGYRIDPNLLLYNSLKQAHWPEFDKFIENENKTLDIIQELYNNFEPPDSLRELGKFYAFKKIFNISDQVLKPIKLASVKMHNYFFWSTIDFYRQKPEILNLLTSDYPKPLNFDVLLGRKKFHRDLIFSGIDHKKNYVTYMTKSENPLFCGNKNFVWPTEILGQDPTIEDTASEVKVDGIIVSLSQIIPVDIYNQTAYSLVCESLSVDNFSFFTEKTIKPMLAKRLFLVCSGRHFLRNLKSLGFVTFDNIVDESYDNEWDLETRVSMILEQAERLSAMNQQEVYTKARAAVEHNFNRLMQHDWQQEMIDLIKEELVSLNK